MILGKWSDEKKDTKYPFVCERRKLRLISWQAKASQSSTMLPNTVDCRYNAVQYSQMLYKWLQVLTQNINQMLDPQETPHISP